MVRTLTADRRLISSDSLLRLREDFPAIAVMKRRSLSYLDSAATSLVPTPVAQAALDVETKSFGAVGRGVHRGSIQVQEQYEAARHRIAAFINAQADEIIFVRNATEALNLIASSLCYQAPRTEVVVTEANHHSCLLGWYRDNRARMVPTDGRGDVSSRALVSAIGPKTALVAIPTVSNALGIALPYSAAIRAARSAGALTLLDASQSVAHESLDVRSLDVDFVAFSGHKMLAPSGIGILFARRDRMEALDTHLLGGGMVSDVTPSSFRPLRGPHRFEAGTPNVGGAVGLAAAARYIDAIGHERIGAHTRALAQRCWTKLKKVPGVLVHGPDDSTVARTCVAFSVPGLEAHEVARVLSERFGVLVRSGHVCAQLHTEKLSIDGIIRASFHVYSTPHEADRLVSSLRSLTSHLRS